TRCSSDLVLSSPTAPGCVAIYSLPPDSTSRSNARDETPREAHVAGSAGGTLLCRGLTFSTGQWKMLSLDTGEFLRRFLQHVLPSGFHRVRYYGWWSPAAKNKWQRILALFDWKAPDRKSIV